MIIKTRCDCGHINVSNTSMEWVKHGVVPVSCKECDSIYMATSVVDDESVTIDETGIKQEQEQEQEEKTNYEIASRVIVNNKEHEFYGHEGIIVDKDFLHYKVQLPNKTIWMPYHWVSLKKSI